MYICKASLTQLNAVQLMLLLHCSLRRFSTVGNLMQQLYVKKKFKWHCANYCCLHVVAVASCAAQFG